MADISFGWTAPALVALRIGRSPPLARPSPAQLALLRERARLEDPAE